MQIIDNAQPATIAKGETFAVDHTRGSMRSDVSTQWWNRPDDEKYLSLTDLHNAVKARYDSSAERRVANRDVELFTPELRTKEDTQKLFIGLPGGAQAAFSHWSFGQTCGLAKAPAAYLRTLPSPLAAHNLNYGLRHARDVEEVKIYHGTGDDAQLHAVTGPKYGRIPDYEMVKAVMQIAGNGDGSQGWKVPGIMNWATGRYNPYVDVTKENTTLYASDRDMFVFLVDDTRPIKVGELANGEPDYLFRGFFAYNSEVGNRSFGVATMYLRGVCMNRCLWGVEGFSEIRGRHSSGAPDRFITEIKPALHSYANGSTARLVEGVAAAKAAKVASNDKAALEFLKGMDFPAKQAMDILETGEREEGARPRSAWDMAQAITAVARREPNQDTRVGLEIKAGRILDKVTGKAA